ncbi:hypothetical protein GCM10027614_33440 [Micromonospora vulcania]
MCRGCGHPWPCGESKLALTLEYERDRVSLFVYLAGLLHEATGDLWRLHPDEPQSGPDLFDRFMGWPSQRMASYRVRPIDGLGVAEDSHVEGTNREDVTER